MSYILTLKLDPASQDNLNRLRQQYFPPAINYIDAHVTLFHHLPEQPAVVEALQTLANAQSFFKISVIGLRSLGKGVAYTLESSELQALHSSLSTSFAEHLSPQDRQKFQPHIVVQNKVAPEQAKTLLHELRGSFVRTQIEATGLSLWHYRNGPWELAEVFAFT